MNTKKAAAIVVGALLVASIVPAKADDPHVEMIQAQQDEAMLMDGRIISTFTGTMPTLLYPARMDFI
jgi:hypothetical protein